MTTSEMARLIKLLVIRLNQLEQNIDKFIEDLLDHNIELEKFYSTDDEDIAEEELNSLLDEFKFDILHSER
ncbi:MAG TPA: hypothetical protein PKV66_03385 [Candidatus Pelethenecus sp.]|nr:hypothetical protein [Candidatus Pelethenecus sp.]